MQKKIACYLKRKSKIFLFLFFAAHSHFCFSQKTDSTKNLFHLKGAVTVTNKGISFIPTFTLGKPATIFDLSLGKRKLFFEPQFRYGLNGKPWSFIFWWRYKLVNTGKFKMNIGAHPSVVFKTISTSVNGTVMNVIQGNRYVATEIAPNYIIAKNVSVGMYYLFSHGLDKGTASSTHFLTVNSNFSHIRIGSDFFALAIPQFYYLKQDRNDGFYFTSTIGLSKKKFPLSMQALFNKIIRSSIPGSSDFVWNASLIYSFNNTYVKHK